MLKRAIQVALTIAALSVAGHAQQTCSVTTTIQDFNLQPLVGAKIIVHKVRSRSTTGPIISAVPRTYLPNSSGQFSILLPRNSVAWIEAPMDGLYVAGGVPLDIPNQAS